MDTSDLTDMKTLKIKSHADKKKIVQIVLYAFFHSTQYSKPVQQTTTYAEIIQVQRLVFKKETGEEEKKQKTPL